jgi:hypothetical protein
MTDDRAVIAFALQVGDAEGNDVFLLRNLALGVVQHLTLEHHDRVVVANRAFQEALRVVRRAWTHDLEAGNVRQP